MVLSIKFPKHWDNIRLTNVLLLWGGPKSCSLLCFACIKAISDEPIAFVGSPKVMSPIMFYMHWGNIRLTQCFGGIAHIHVFPCALHALGQYQPNDLLLWGRPNSCYLFCSTHAGATSDWRIASVGLPEVSFPIVFQKHWGNIRLTNSIASVGSGDFIFLSCFT